MLIFSTNKRKDVQSHLFVHRQLDNVYEKKSSKKSTWVREDFLLSSEASEHLNKTQSYKLDLLLEKTILLVLNSLMMSFTNIDQN